jgi:DNA (cytosine-5)-methyltransferase 1
LCRYTPPSRKAGERVAPSVTSGPPFSRTGNDRVEAEAMIPVAGTLSSREKGGGGLGSDFDMTGGIIPQPYKVGNCLTKRMHKEINTTLDEGQTPVISFESAGHGEYKEGVGTLRASGRDTGGGSETTVVFDKGLRNEAREGYSARRLTPLECSRLQGFPDDWARIPWRGKGAESCPDGPQYKAYGNSMAGNVMRWLGERIDKENEL